MGILKVLLIITLLSIPTGEIARVEVAPDIGINLIDICLSITSAYGILYFLKNRLFNFGYEKYIFLFIIVGLFSMVINSGGFSLYQIFVSFLYPLRFLFLFMIFPLVKIQTLRFKKILGKILIFDGIVITVLGFLQFLFYPSLRNLYYLGWDEHLYRLFSTFLDPNFTGIFLVIFIFYLLSLTFPLKKEKMKINIFFVTSIILSSVALFLTYSRGALGAFLLVSSVFIFLNKKKYILVLLMCALMVFLFQLNTVRSEGTNILRMTSVKARIGSSFFAATIIKDHPIFGVGFNSYKYVVEKYNSSKNFPINKFPSHASAPDNSFLFVLATTGMLGFVPYMLFWYKILKEKFINFEKADNMLIIASIAVLFISSFFVNALFYTPIMLWFLSLLGLKENK